MISTKDPPMQADVKPPPIIPLGESALDFLRDNVPEIRIRLRESTGMHGNQQVTRMWREAEFVGTDSVRVEMELDADGESDCATHSIYHKVDGFRVHLLVTPHWIYPAINDERGMRLACDWVFEIGAVQS